MKAVFLRVGIIVLAAAVAGCTTGQDRGVDVTRFHLNQAIARGQIAIEPADPADANSLEFRTYEAAIARQLASLGWTIVPTLGNSEQVAVINVERAVRPAVRRGSPVSVGVGGGTGGWGSGVGAGVSVGLGGGSARAIIATLLEVRLKRRSDGTVMWEGRASTEAAANSDAAAPAIAIERLATALFRGFPGESGRTIKVR